MFKYYLATLYYNVYNFTSFRSNPKVMFILLIW